MRLRPFLRNPKYRRRQLRRLYARLVRYPVEGALVWLGYAASRAVGLDRASAAAGALARLIGPRLGKSRAVLRRIRRALPELSEAEARRVLIGCWDNVGRVAAEFPHVARIDIFGDPERVRVEGAEIIDRLRDDGRPGIFFGAHIANWELLAFGAAQRGLRITGVYRHANNPVSERLYRSARAHPNIELVRKEHAGGTLLAQRLREGRHLALLADQKLRQGVPVPFFGRDAMTAPTPALLALRFRCPLVPAHVVRLEGARFRVIVEPPLELPDTGNVRADMHTLLTRINAIIEGWVRDHPEQWLWLHRRWGDD